MPELKPRSFSETMVSLACSENTQQLSISADNTGKVKKTLEKWKTCVANCHRISMILWFIIPTTCKHRGFRSNRLPKFCEKNRKFNLKYGLLILRELSRSRGKDSVSFRQRRKDAITDQTSNVRRAELRTQYYLGVPQAQLTGHLRS